MNVGPILDGTTAEHGERWSAYCTDALELLRALPDGCARLICTDPPYFRIVGDEWDNRWNRHHKFIEWLGTIIAEIPRVLAPNGSLYMFAWSKSSAEIEMLIGQQLNVLNSIVWVKPGIDCEINNGSGQSAQQNKEIQRLYYPRQERVIFAEHKFDPFADRERVLRQETFATLGKYFRVAREMSGLSRNDAEVKLGFVGKNGSGRGTSITTRWEQGEAVPTRKTYLALRDLYRASGAPLTCLPLTYDQIRAMFDRCKVEFERQREEVADLRRPFNMDRELGAASAHSDVWTDKPIQGSEGKHPCEKPLSMLDRIVRVSTNPGDVVVDPFAGSFSLGVASVAAGRRFIGGDSAPRWFAAGCHNLRSAEAVGGLDIAASGSIRKVRSEAAQPRLF